jgi:hypothetical protein
MQPGKYNIIIQRRADFVLQLQFRDDSGASIDLSGWGAYSEIWDKGRTEQYSEFDIIYNDPEDGKIQLYLEGAETSKLPDECFYDVMLENLDGLKQYYLEGLIYVSEGYTDPL